MEQPDSSNLTGLELLISYPGKDLNVVIVVLIQLPVGLIAQLVRALHRYSQRSWVRFPFRPEFFSGLISQLLKLSIYCDDLHLFKMCFPQYKYMTFMYSYHSGSHCCVF